MDGFVPKDFSRSPAARICLRAHQSFLVSCLVQFTVVAPAKRDSEFITHLEPDRPRLRKSEMVRI